MLLCTSTSFVLTEEKTRQDRNGHEQQPANIIKEHHSGLRTPMHSRVVEQSTREESPPSGSEKSFVSAASENASDWSNKTSRMSQSALPSLPRHSTVAPSHFTPPNTSQASNGTHDLVAGPGAFSTSSSTSPIPLAPQSGSYFAQQPGASGNEARSPPSRRPPASRSSHGIETSSGPPPALSTRRSYNAESPWRTPPPSDPGATHPPMVHSASIDSIVRQPRCITNDPVEPIVLGGVRPAQSRELLIAEGGTKAMDGRHEIQSGSEEDQDLTLRINGHKLSNGRHTRNDSGQQPSQSSQEDLFLNLARADSVVHDGSELSNKSERKRSRIRGSSLQQPRDSQPSSSHRPSTSVGGFSQRVSPMQYKHYESSFNPSIHRLPEKASLFSFRDSPANRRSYAASAHPLDQQQWANNTRTSFGGTTGNAVAQDPSLELQLGNGRRRSTREQQSNLSYAPNGDYESSYFSGHPDQSSEVDDGLQTPHAEGTESTVSTTAPSTVWDELEDMKSRIRKLEITGKLPASSNAAMSNTFRERPPTATTTMTTNSSSPKHRHIKSVSPEASTFKAPEVANVHPLLHAALAKTKPAMNANLYKALEATALDALTLAAMARSITSQDVSPNTASIVGTSEGVDRRMRRKADNLCRSLTEFCIALSEETQETEIAVGRSRPGSGNVSSAARQSPLQDFRSIRATSDEPQYRSSSRVMSRLEARRTSLALGSSPLSRRESPQEAATPTQAVPLVSNRLDRTSSVIHRNHTSEDQVDTTSHRRPLSRASTEIGQIRQSPQIRTSREYTSQHPLPNPPQHSPSVQSSLPIRKSYFPPASQSPVTPSVPLGNRRHLDRSTPPSSGDSSRLAEARQRRIASLSQHTSAG